MAFITVAGQNKIAAKQGAHEVLNITHFVLANISGLGAEPVDRIEALPSLGNIVDTRLVTLSGYVNSNQVVYSLVIDSSVGNYDFNWVGLKDADGVLIACAHIPLIHKIANSGTTQGNNLTRNFLLAFNGIAATTAIAVPAETWQIDFNNRLWGIDERERLSNFDIYGHEAFFDDGYKIYFNYFDGLDYLMAYPGVGYVGGVRAESLIPVTFGVQMFFPNIEQAVWLDVSLEGDISDVSAVTSFIVDSANESHVDYTDAFGFNHYVTRLANIGVSGELTDVRNKYGKRIYKFIGNGTFTVPPGVKKIYVSGCAAGGGGGGGGGNATGFIGSGGAGGGAGESIIKQEFSVTPGQSIPITIGGSGNGGIGVSGNSGTTGTAGGNTVIGSLVTLIGGSGGQGGLTATSSENVAGPLGGAGWPQGGCASDTTFNNSSGNGGYGASGPYGGGSSYGRGATALGINAGSAFGYGAGGGGGGGCYRDFPTSAGGNGSTGCNGIAIIEW